MSNNETKIELADKLNINALSGWIKQPGDETEAIPSLVRFHQKTDSGRRSPLRHILGYAAAAAGAFLLSWALFSDMDRPEVIADNSIQELIVPAGQRAQLKLSDGTRVWVNSNSTLSYPSVFSKEERRVEITGEVYFEVAKDEQRPFYVQSPKAEVKVLGTHFDVFDYNEDDLYSTALLEGAVEVNFNEGEYPTVSLVPGQYVSKIGKTVTQGTFSDIDFLLWKKGVYAFNDCNFADMVEKLELYYDVDIVLLNNDLAKYKFTGKFRQRDGIESLLRTLQKVKSFKYVKDDDTNVITIH